MSNRLLNDLVNEPNPAQGPTGVPWVASPNPHDFGEPIPVDPFPGPSARRPAHTTGLDRRRFLTGLAMGLPGLGAMDPARPPRVVLVSGEFEYGSRVTLPGWQADLSRRFAWSGRLLHRQGGENLPGLEAVRGADLLILYIRRMTLPAAQLRVIRDHLAAGKPILALRTSSHAFENWPEWDPSVLGGNYQGHRGNHLPATAHVVPNAIPSPLLRHLPASFPSAGSLYRNAPLPEGSRVILKGTVEGDIDPEPIAWYRQTGASRIFYTSLGSPSDFLSAPFVQLITNAAHWCLDRPVPEAPVAGLKQFPIAIVDLEAFDHLAKHHRTVPVDVRPPDDFARGRIKTALSLPWTRNGLTPAPRDWERERPIVVYGPDPETTRRSARALQQAGFHFISEFPGDWRRSQWMETRTR